jgi:hypothetical protein
VTPTIALDDGGARLDKDAAAQGRPRRAGMIEPGAAFG